MSTTLTNNNNIYGYVAPNWENVRDAFEQNIVDELDIGASLSIYYRGECVVDLYGGWKDKQKNEPYTPDTLQIIFSLSKGVIGAAIALCVERGWLDYDISIAKYWPEFSVNGKENITVGDLLSHQAGLPYIDQILTLEDACNWSKMIDLLIAEKPHWKPGSGHGYHGHTTGYIAGELIHRVDPQQRSYGQFVREELDKEYYVGILDDKVEARIAPLFEKQIDKKINDNPSLLSLIYDQTLTCSGALPLGQPKMIYNELQVHRAVLPAVNGITNARSLAKIYSLLINDVHENGKKLKCLLSKNTLTQAITNITPDDEPDITLYNQPTTFSKSGFQTFGDCFKILGNGAFGHTGYGGSCAFAYLPCQLTYAYVCNQLDPLALTVDSRSTRVIQAIENILKHNMNKLIDKS